MLKLKVTIGDGVPLHYHSERDELLAVAEDWFEYACEGASIKIELVNITIEESKEFAPADF